MRISQFPHFVCTIVCALGLMLETAGAASIPVFEFDPSWPKVPAKWMVSQPSGIAVDANDHIWVLQRPRSLPADKRTLAGPPVMVFDREGNFIKAWGGDGAGYEWPQREHGLYIDQKGFVWIGGNYCPGMNLPGLKPVADDQLLKFDQNGKFILQIGKSSQSKGNADTRNFLQPANANVYARTNELFVADGYGNHRVIVLDATTGAFKRMWGAFGNKPADKVVCPPRTFDPATNGGEADQFTVVHAVRISDDGMVYVADRENRRVQMFTLEGKFVKQLVLTSEAFARDLAFSRDPDQQFLYVGGDPDIVIVDRKRFEIVGNIHVPGMRGRTHSLDVDSKGNLYVATTYEGLQKLVVKHDSGSTR